MSITDIDWSRNCMTVGIHNGRDEVAFYTSLSQMDLSDGAIFNMVEQAIKEDAQQYVDHAGYTQEFADLVCELWEQYFESALKSARKNAVLYIQDLKDIEDRYGKEHRNKRAERRALETNSSCNDHVTYICRRCGVNASQEASRILEGEDKSIKVEETSD